jgi:prepilin-type N-terminal cleavage/methylation domain-containing protein
MRDAARAVFASRTAKTECRRPNAECRGFTLIEVVLAVAMLTLLFGLAAMNYFNWSQSRKLEEGRARVESLVRMCRSEACNLGKRIELAMDEEGAMVVRVEADPIGAPNVFVPLETTWARSAPNHLVRVVRSELLGASSWRLITRKNDGPESEAGLPLHPITFFPDATSDSAELELRQVDREDGLHVLVTINGLTSELSAQLFKPMTEEEKREAERRQNSLVDSVYASGGSSATPPPPPCPDH